MGTRDEKGVFGMWWTIGLKEHNGTHAMEAAQVEGVDYRNRGLPSDSAWAGPNSIDSRFIPGQTHAITDDPNERGRGRTVESHSGGVAVLRAHYEFSSL